MKQIKDFFKRFPEIYSVPIALVAWVLSIPLLRLFDNTSAVYDAGVFQVIIFSIIQTQIGVMSEAMTKATMTCSIVAR